MTDTLQTAKTLAGEPPVARNNNKPSISTASISSLPSARPTSRPACYNACGEFDIVIGVELVHPHLLPRSLAWNPHIRTRCRRS